MSASQNAFPYSRCYRITEDDLRELEAALPELCDRVGTANNDPRVQMLFQRCKEIVSDVRWSYGPPQAVEYRGAQS